MKRLVLALLVLHSIALAQLPRWTVNRANDWYADQPWLVGSNYIPATAINELEMWQAETFDPQRIELELGWAEGLGMNTMRVFLHDLLWQQDAPGFRQRIDTFLSIAKRHHIRPVFVLFDSCWDPAPHLGPQKKPVPGVHNSGWVQSPGAAALQDASQRPRLEAYVKGVVGAFAKDKRILAWDVWNEPDNLNTSSYGKLEPANKIELVLDLLPRVFEWAREANPRQPLTSGVWKADLTLPMAKLQLALSDVTSFHSYEDPSLFPNRIVPLQQLGRPILCTEYMARGRGSTFEGWLPLFKQYKIGAINWGFVAGKTQTNLPWDSWQQPYVDREPAVWFHEVFRTDGSPYKKDEVDLIRSLTPQPARRRLFW